MTTTIEDVRDFLAQRRIAMIGVSRNPKDFSRVLFRDLCKWGYDMVAVNRSATEIDGHPCFASVREIQPAPDGALLMAPASQTLQLVRECEAAGVGRIWMYRAGGQGAVNKDAVEFCHTRGLHLVEGHCPYMFLQEAPFFHRLHGFVLKLTGGYPRKAAEKAA